MKLCDEISQSTFCLATESDVVGGVYLWRPPGCFLRVEYTGKQSLQEY